MSGDSSPSPGHLQLCDSAAMLQYPLRSAQFLRFKRNRNRSHTAAFTARLATTRDHTAKNVPCLCNTKNIFYFFWITTQDKQTKKKAVMLKSASKHSVTEGYTNHHVGKVGNEKNDTKALWRKNLAKKQNYTHQLECKYIHSYMVWHCSNAAVLFLSLNA